MKRVIGLTGMSGAGKSTAAEAMRRLGAVVLDCDAIAREALNDEGVMDKLVHSFGGGIVGEDGRIIRRKLAQKAFADRNSTELLNKATHPFIIGRVRDGVENAADGQTVVIDAPLLFQSGLDCMCDAVIAVVSDPETLAGRISERDGLSAAEAAARLSAQEDMPELLKRADYIINNGRNMSVAQLMAEAANIYGRINNNVTNGREKG